MEKIGIDALGIDVEGGGRTSILNLILYLVNNTNNYYFIIYLSKYEPQLNLPRIKQVVLPFRRGVLARLFMQLYLPADVFIRNIKIIHFTKSQASLVFRAKTVLTIHDLTILKYPNIHSNISVLYWRFIQPIIIKRMNAIITVSEDAANDINEVYKVSKEKILVVYNSSQFSDINENSSKVTKEYQDKYALKGTYILYVGLIALKKNLDTLVRALQILNKENNSFPPLYLIGPRYSDSDAGNIFDLIEELNLSKKVIYLGMLPKIDLFHIFRNAKIFVFPSLHEGFGIPCLESMELGVPLIASKASAIPEIVGDAGILVEDYLSPVAWSSNIAKLYNDEKKQKELVSKGFERIKLIKKKHSYQTVVSLYADLLNR